VYAETSAMTIAIPPEFGYAVGVMGASVFVSMCKIRPPARGTPARPPSARPRRHPGEAPLPVAQTAR
jgi:hypothetical protein